MDKVNQELAGKILFEDPKTGEELRPDDDPRTDSDGNLVITVSSRCGKRNWKHTIKTEEI